MLSTVYLIGRQWKDRKKDTYERAEHLTNYPELSLPKIHVSDR